ncbi:hypothetical protein GCM10007392_26930 [Saccharospirillum salsuginis]|uniref:MipA/OmpV family protein n=1 Tax=Saccharospirillum salsuginis TaxID=418750 RepID=A0A918KBU8_9GAMM|nr:hypothetical protein GCM10007392_26930 [Saccharospirillum salsuginis]
MLPAPSFQLDINGYRLQTRGPGFAADLVPSNRLSLGPVVRYSGGRSEDDLGEKGKGLPTVPASVETGLSVGSGIPWRVVGVPLPGVALAQLDVFTTLPGGHESPYATASGGWVTSVTDRWSLIGTLGASYYSAEYSDRFFSLDDATAQATGLEAYDADAGWQDLSLTLVSNLRWTPRWSLFTLVSVSRYQGDAARSPIIRQLDARNRYLGVLGVSYQWLGD